MKKFLLGLTLGLTFVAGMVFADNFSEIRVPAGGDTGGIRDSSGNLCIFGANISSCAILIDAQDNVLIQRLKVVEDTELEGNLQVGPCNDTYVPKDPDGAINLCRSTSQQAQGFIRIWRQNTEYGRIGLSANDRLDFKREAGDATGWEMLSSGSMCMRDSQTGNITNKLSFVNGILTVGTC